MLDDKSNKIPQLYDLEIAFSEISKGNLPVLDEFFRANKQKQILKVGARTDVNTCGYTQSLFQIYLSSGIRTEYGELVPIKFTPNERFLILTYFIADQCAQSLENYLEIIDRLRNQADSVTLETYRADLNAVALLFQLVGDDYTEVVAGLLN